MTATTISASSVLAASPPCPAWCDGHEVGSEVHTRDLPGTWGDAAGGPVLGLALERVDTERGPGVPRIVVQVSHDGVVVDHAVALGTASAEDYAISFLRLIDVGRAGA